MRPKWFMCSWYLRHKSCTYLASRLALSPNKLNQTSTWASSLRCTIGCVKTISKPTVCLVQTVHLSCKDTNTISKRNKTRFHMTQVTFWYHRVRPKWFLRISELPLEPYYLGVQPVASITISEPMINLRKTVHLSCTDTTLSPNGPKRDSTWPTSPRSSIGCVQNNF
jgi:hypothetical protein